MNKVLDLDKIWVQIRKSTPKRFDRMLISRQKDGCYKLVITSEDTYCTSTMEFLSCIINHEFLHVILGEFVSVNYYGKEYDNLLKSINRYSDDTVMEDWL
jgi:hypothetical protein